MRIVISINTACFLFIDFQDKLYFTYIYHEFQSLKSY